MKKFLLFIPIFILILQFLFLKYFLILILIFINKQEIPAIADKPARRESLPKIAPIRRAYNVVADNTGLSSFV